MVNEFSHMMQDASRVVNSILGATCIYRSINNITIKNVHIVIDKNQPIQTEYGVIAGYRVEASILKSEVPKVQMNDKFIDEDDVTWRINALIKDTAAKWYVDVVQE